MNGMLGTAGGPNAASLRAAVPAARLCWSGGKPPDPRASRATIRRASGTTKRATVLRASGTRCRLRASGAMAREGGR